MARASLNDCSCNRKLLILCIDVLLLVLNRWLQEKTLKLVQIWERGGIFPEQTLLDFKAKLDARPERG